ncbi:MAG: ROK family protein [Dehalococcoidia bacterium]|nr:ROK family protein [Dehalococcoidia bacterium]MSQ16587.1 ROK family protein [Dehalococcoidia bacterium]
MAESSEVVVAMDWGGTWARAAVVDRQGAVRWRSRQANPTGADRAALLAVGLEVLRQAVAWCGTWPIVGVGIGIAALVDGVTGTLEGSPHLRPLNGVSLKALWEPELGHPIWTGNDANLAALGEFHYGAGHAEPLARTPPKTLFYMTVSTGIGGGLVHQGEVYVGAHGLAVEPGHMVIDWRPDAPKCDCGSAGCLEALASGSAVARRARQRRAEPYWRNSSLAGLPEDAITSEAVFEAAGRGDALAIEIVDEVVQALAAGLAGVLHLVDPDLLVLGGGVTQGLVALDRLPAIQALMRQRAMSNGHRRCPLVPARLGDAAGLVGAARLVWQQTPQL